MNSGILYSNRNVGLNEYVLDSVFVVEPAALLVHWAVTPLLPLGGGAHLCAVWTQCGQVADKVAAVGDEGASASCDIVVSFLRSNMRTVRQFNYYGPTETPRMGIG